MKLNIAGWLDRHGTNAPWTIRRSEAQFCDAKASLICLEIGVFGKHAPIRLKPLRPDNELAVRIWPSIENVPRIQHRIDSHDHPIARVRLRPVTQISQSRDDRSVGGDLAGRLVQVSLALYLIPALMVVLVVGGMGMLVLAIGRLFTGSIHRAAG